MPDGLRTVPQDDFAAGRVTSVAPHLVPRNGLLEAINTLLDDDGSAYRRGGCDYKSAGGLGAAGLTWLWDGYLAAGQRTLFASAAKWGVLAGDDSTVVDLGAGGVALPTHAVEVGGILFIANGQMYAGSRKTADYVAGTVTTTTASATVAGVGTAFSANVDAGMLLRVGGSGRYYVVKSVDNNTQITLTEPVLAGAAGSAYVLSRFGSFTQAPYFTLGTVAAVAAVADRLVVCADNRAYFTPPLSTTGPHSFDPTDYHELVGGVRILGAASIRDTLLLFATDGMWAAYNLALDLTDAAGSTQQRLEHLSRDVILWGPAGVATWNNALIVPAVDGVYLVDGMSAPRRVSNSITPDIVRQVGAGYLPGTTAIHRSHYFLPVLDATGAPIDLHVCRLDRRTRDNRIGDIYPWTRMAGFGAQVAAFAVRVPTGAARQPELLGASRAAGSRVLKHTAFFAPDGAHKNDADGSTHPWDVTLPDSVVGPGLGSTVRRLRIRYEMADAGSDNPLIRAQFGIGSAASGPAWGAVDWGEFSWSDPRGAALVAIGGAAPEDDGNHPWTFHIRPPVKAPRIRARLLCVMPTARLTLRSSEWFVRQTGKM